MPYGAVFTNMVATVPDLLINLISVNSHSQGPSSRSTFW